MSDNSKQNKSITALKTLIREAILRELFTDKAFLKSSQRRKRFKKKFEDKDTPRVAKAINEEKDKESL